MKRALIVKEVKGFLKNPQFIVSIVLIPVLFVALGEVAAYGVGAAREELQELRLLVLDMDGTEYSRFIVSYLSIYMGAEVVSSKPAEPLRDGILLVIPEGFGDSVDKLREGSPAILRVGVEASVTSISFSGLAPVEAALGLVSTVNDLIRKALVESAGLDPRILENVVVEPDARVYLGGRLMGLAEARDIVNSIALSYFVLLVLIALSMQFAALSMAQEKEQKTFEMLLAQPIPRSHIGVAKIVSVILVSVLEVLAFSIAWYYYLKRAQGNLAPETQAGGGSYSEPDLVEVFLGLAGPEGVALFVASIIISMFSASILGLIIGGLSRDTKTAGVLIAPLWMIVMFIGFVAEFTGFPRDETLLILMGLLVIPGPLAVLNSALTGSIGAAIGAVLASIVTSIMFLAALARLLDSDVIVTGLRLWARREAQLKQ